MTELLGTCKYYIDSWKTAKNGNH